MKRLMPLLLAILLLAGCGSKTEVFPEGTGPTVAPTEPVNLYIANSSVEQQTGGAVKVYVPEDATYIGMAAMDGKVVLVSDLSELILVDGETGVLGDSIKVGETISCEAADFTVSDQGISYYRKDGRELVFLNTSLQQESKVEIPEGISGDPCVSHTNQEIYYCKDKEVRALHMQTGISRMVKSQVCQSIELVASHLDGTMLVCRVVDENGKEGMIYIDSATGQTLDAVNQLTRIQTSADQYLLSRTEGIVDQQIFGTLGKESQLFTLEYPMTAVFQLGGGYRWYMDEGALVMDFYDFASGTHKSSIRMVGVTEPISVAADNRYIWFLAMEGETEMLYRWDVSQSLTKNQHSYIEPLYTRSEPDTKGLQQCAQKALELKEQYGIHFHVGEDATSVTGGYELVDEYLAPALAEMLDRIEVLLSQFPAEFLPESLAKGEMHISLVRSISGGKEVVQFYENGDAYVLLQVSDQIEENFLNGVAYIIDSHVLGNSRDYDEWKKLNPDGFDYDYNYYAYDSHSESEYLTDENRYFVDAYAMSFPHEDRCRLFVYAMLPGNESIFEGDAMQAKLKRMCQGVREAYKYEKDGNTYVWEQYLNISLANSRG